MLLTDPDRVWKRIKSKGLKPRDFAVLKAVAKWRELEAQQRNVPRTRILKDEGLVEIATHPPKDDQALERIRMVPKGFGRSAQGKRLLEAVQAGLAVPDSDLPQKEKRLPPPRGIGPVMDLLRVLLKAKSEELEVAPRVLANADDLEKIASEDKPDVPAMQGWRYDAFGKFAEDLKEGRLALSVGKKGVKVQVIG